MRSQVPRYSFGEEIANAISHGVGWVLSAGGLGLIVTMAALNRRAVDIVSVSVFAASLILLYGSSTMYHALAHDAAKKVFRIFDHTAIYILIAGTYTPIALGILGGNLGWTLFGLIWALAAAGVGVTLFAPSGLRWLELVLYLAMGWLVVFVGRTLLAILDPLSLWLLFSGGLSYTFGLIFYGWRRLPYGHMVWHMFVLAGSVLHFLAILFSVALK